MSNELMKKNYLAPINFEQAERFAKMLAESDFAPKDFKNRPANIMIALQVGFFSMQMQNAISRNGFEANWTNSERYQHYKLSTGIMLKN